MAAHTYWRIYITNCLNDTVSGPGFATVAEMEMYDAAGTSLTTGGTASASSYLVGEAAVAANAFDGNFSNYWCSANKPDFGPPEWLAYQFAAPVDVKVIRFSPRLFVNQYPTAFKFQYSDDGSSWTDATALVIMSHDWKPSYRGVSLAIGPAAGTYPNWRIMVTATQDGNPITAAEIEFRETVGGADLTSPSTIWPLVSDSGSVYAEAFDNNSSTRLFYTIASPTWIGYALKRSVAVAQVMWQAANDATWARAATAYTLQASYDTVTWVNMGSGTFATWTAPGQIQTSVTTGGGALRIHPGMEGRMQILAGGMRG